MLVRTTVSPTHTSYQPSPQAHPTAPQQLLGPAQSQAIQQQQSAQQVRVRSLSPGGALRPAMTPSPSQPVGAAIPKDAAPPRTPSFPAQARQPVAESAALQFVQPWHGQKAVNQSGIGKEPLSPASSQATALIFPPEQVMALNVSHQSSVSCSGGTGADYGITAPTLDAISARLDEVVAALNREFLAGLQDLREWADEKFMATEQDNRDQLSLSERCLEGFRIELTSLREEFRAVEETTTARLENLEACQDSTEDKLETQADALQRLEQHVQQDVQESLASEVAQLRDTVMSEMHQRADGDREISEEVQVQQKALRRLEKCMSELSHQLPKVQQDSEDLAVQYNGMRDRSKDLQGALDCIAQQSSKSLEQLHVQLQTCKEQLLQMTQDMDRRIGSVESTMQTSLAQKADQDWVDETMHMRVQSISGALRKEMADRSAMVQQALDDSAHNSARWRQLQGKLEDLHMEVHEKSLNRHSTSTGGPGYRPDRPSIIGSNGVGLTARDSGGGSGKEVSSTKGPPRRSPQGRSDRSLSWLQASDTSCTGDCEEEK